MLNSFLIEKGETTKTNDKQATGLLEDLYVYFMSLILLRVGFFTVNLLNFQKFLLKW